MRLPAPLILFSCLCLPAFGDEPAPQNVIRIAPETTFITTPLDSRGFPDYRAHLNRVLSEGVTNENNALIPYWRAMGNPEGNEAFRKELEACLGVTLFDPAQPHLVTITDVAKEYAGDDQVGINRIYEQQSAASTRPWKAEEFPAIAKWIQRNEKPLEIVYEGTRREKYFNPLIGEEGEMLIATLLPGVQGQRELARLLSARAMLRLGRGDAAGAREDALAIHRMGRHVAQGWTLIETLVGYALDSIADRCDQQIALSGLLTAEELAAYRTQLHSLGAFQRFAPVVSVGERCMSLDAVVGLTQPQKDSEIFSLLDGRSLAGNSEFGKAVQGWLLRTAVDWNVVLAMVNEHFDKTSKAASLPTHFERQKALTDLEMELAKTKGELMEPFEIAKLIFLGSEHRGRNMGNVLLALLAPAVRQVDIAENRINVQRDVTQVGFAICAYRAREGKLPESLTDLVPNDLEELPGDGFNSRELRYTIRGDDFAVYSVGKNFKDDAGLTYGDVPGEDTDDQVFRTPGWFTPPAEEK